MEPSSSPLYASQALGIPDLDAVAVAGDLNVLHQPGVLAQPRGKRDPSRRVQVGLGRAGGEEAAHSPQLGIEIPALHDLGHEPVVLIGGVDVEAAFEALGYDELPVISARNFAGSDTRPLASSVCW